MIVRLFNRFYSKYTIFFTTIKVYLTAVRNFNDI